jgi:hypothetical protein
MKSAQHLPKTVPYSWPDAAGLGIARELTPPNSDTHTLQRRLRDLFEGWRGVTVERDLPNAR